MRIYKDFYKKAAALAAVAALLLSLVSCSRERSAYTIMQSFLREYGAEIVIYSPSVVEGEEGYVGDDFFETLFIYGEEYVTDYAAALASDVFSVFECDVILCESEYGADKLEEFCRDRLQLLERVSKLSGIGFPDGSFVKRYGTVVVLSAISDNARAQRIFDGMF